MYFGVDYYPEQWDYSLIDDDLNRIANSELNCIRIAEFAWHLMEPRENEFDFSFFEMILNKAHKLGLKVMLGTPTATVPAWLYKKDPKIFSIDENGLQRHFGGRRQACLNSPTYNKYAERITQKMVEAYHKHPALLLWHIDNELGHETSDMCYCDQCELEFRNYLKEEFNNNINSFNDAIGSVFWSQTYNNFDEINIPRPTIPAPNPGMMLYFNRFRAQTTTNFLARQAKVIKDIVPNQQTLHNFTGDYFSKAQDHTDLAEQIDIVALNNYPVWGGQQVPVDTHKTAMKLDQTRGFHRKNYWITEQLIGAQAHNVMGFVPRPGHAKLWSFQAMARGCENLIYFRWRTATKGAEQFCYGVLDHDNKYNHRYNEMLDIIKLAKQNQQAIKSPTQSKVALIYSMDNIYSWRIQQQSTAFNIQHEHARLYKPFFDANISVDVLDIRHNFSSYSILLLPVAMLITDENIARIKTFIKNGGTVIATFRAGLKEYHNEIRFGVENPIHELAGVKAEYFEPLPIGADCKIKYQGKDLAATVWRDMLTVKESSKSLCNYIDEFENYSAAVKNKVGKGEIYYIGTGIDDEYFWNDLVLDLAKKHHLDTYSSPSDIEVVIKGEKDSKIAIILNHNGNEIEYLGLKLKAYDTQILEYSEFYELYSKYYQ
ncbi:beta-galactosidase [Francisella philomiragia]|uniref:Beta-galactosidase n=1 Tax=Francisella philomiragia TaxID=28110 RepID=A0A0B6CUK2_9GAMM|nr:beta-galactosidase [Francisella philomiragia]AJI54184.1 beta-galactosidase family protein [Francisella philomiragia]